MKPEIFRLSGALRWALSISLGIFSALPIALISKPGDLLPLAVFGFDSLLSLLGIVWVWRSRIIADELGLRWRSLGKEKAATWDQVEDYFITFSRFGQSASRNFVIRLLDGRKLSFDTSLEEYRRFHKIVSERATKTRTKGWLIRGKEGTLSGKSCQVLFLV